MRFIPFLSARRRRMRGIEQISVAREMGSGKGFGILVLD